MILTLSTTHKPASDLGFLLHKHPERVQTFSLPFGVATVAYPQMSTDRCTVALIVEVDPVSLVRGRSGDASRQAVTLGQYVNDRPYAASSFLSTALGKVFRSALNGQCKDRPELAPTALPFEVHLPCLPSRGGESLLRSLFEPLGYTVSTQAIPLDPMTPEWGTSNYFDVRLASTVVLKDLLQHLFVLMPVLDDSYCDVHCGTTRG
jgi:3' terminal RNA ribose 2'-O-methyltransferase Hen1